MKRNQEAHMSYDFDMKWRPLHHVINRFIGAVDLIIDLGEGGGRVWKKRGMKQLALTTGG